MPRLLQLSSFLQVPNLSTDASSLHGRKPCNLASRVHGVGAYGSQRPVCFKTATRPGDHTAGSPSWSFPAMPCYNVEDVGVPGTGVGAVPRPSPGVHPSVTDILALCSSSFVTTVFQQEAVSRRTPTRRTRSDNLLADGRIYREELFFLVCTEAPPRSVAGFLLWVMSDF